MRLRRVVISGFKTFAKRSEVTLEPGITAIVGPNGSGKSNLVDAIRWALGETNARELRGARMDEVIYSGGNGRGRMGFAEVELVLDNEDGRLPLDDVEVAVSRRVVRHGDSEFRLNGDRVRLRDLERVLGATGLTQDGYAVVAQNDIDAIIEATPAQRRALVEQAAGVRALRAACEDALARVSQAELMVQRFDDLLGETEPRLAELAEQAELAVEQRELTARLSELRGSLAREAWRGARAQLRQARRRLEAAEQRLAAAAAAEAAFAHRIGLVRTRLDQQRAHHAAASRSLEEARLLAERAAGDLRRGADRARAGALARAAASFELEAALAEHRARRAERDEAAGGSAMPGGEAEAVAATLRAARAAHDSAVAAQAVAEAAVRAADAEAHAAEQARAEADAAVRRTAAERSAAAEATAALRERLAAAQARHAEAERRLASATELGNQAAEALLAGEAQRARTEAELAAAGAAAIEAQAALDAARDGARVLLARAAALRGQVEGALGGRGAIAAAVAAGELEAQRLLECLTVNDPADSAAIEAALEAHLGAWIVEDVDAAARHFDAGSAREALLSRSMEIAEPPSAPPGARAAIDALTPGPGAEAAVAHCLHGAWLVADRDVARRVVAGAGGRAVLPDGTVVSEGEVRGGGRPGRTLQLASAERDAAAAADEAIAAERTAETVRADAQARLAAATAADARALGALNDARVRAAEAAAGARAAEQSVAEERERARAATGELEAQEAVSPGDESTPDSSLEAAARRVAEARAVAAGARAAAATAQSGATIAAATLRDAEAADARLAAARAELEHRVTVADQAAGVAAARCDAAAGRVLTAELDVLAALARAGAARAAVAATATAVDDALAVMSAVAPELAESERALAALDAERSEVAVVLARAEDERRAAGVEVETAAGRVAELAEAVRDDDEDEGPEPEAGDAEKAEREIVRLERRIVALGPVNALAPEEHERLTARVVVLRAGRNDLGNACADIRAVAARLTAAIDGRFEAVFGAVSVHFHELFAELFPGGRATLRREEPDADDDAVAARGAPRRAGVEILAQPPGKRLQPLSLFSGGERALTALAVILALQQVNPSPFYVFDEVDAPLDDANVLRFTRLLTRLAATQQFVVVTHNHITMAAADALHGVTSDGDGVSTVLSVRFDPESGETVPEGHVVGLRERTVRAAV